MVAAYGLILPRAVLAGTARGCLNIHASLLPRWRGAAPIQRAIMAGDAETGVSIMAMEAGLDTGPVLLAEAVPIGAHDTAGALHARLAALGARLIVEALGAARPAGAGAAAGGGRDLCRQDRQGGGAGGLAAAGGGGRPADPRALALSRAPGARSAASG